jgi:bifunctional DNA-binding transcriptional regulator/antitoxin component of YhaV-PrlF toxin-antitoxin module
MLAKITSKRQVTFPAAVLDALGVGPGDHLDIQPSPAGFLIRPRRVDRGRLAPLKPLIRPETPAFDLEAFRQQAHEASLRD